MVTLNQGGRLETGAILSVEEMGIVQANLRFALENCPLEGGILIEDGTASSEYSVRALLKKLEDSKTRQFRVADLANNDIRLLRAITEYAVKECPIDDAMMLDSGRIVTRDDLRALKEKFSEPPQTNVSKRRAFSAIETLEEEHKLISRVVKLLPKLRQNVESGIVEDRDLSDIVEFFSKFTDGFHHAKEEDQLFPSLQQRGVSPKGCPVGALRLEHEQGRSLTIALDAAVKRYREGNAEDAKTISELLRNAEELYMNHIWKEEYLLFPMSAKVLSAQDLSALAKDFARVQQKFDPSFLERYESIVARLEKSAERTSVHLTVPRASIVSS